MKQREVIWQVTVVTAYAVWLPLLFDKTRMVEMAECGGEEWRGTEKSGEGRKRRRRCARCEPAAAPLSTSTRVTSAAFLSFIGGGSRWLQKKKKRRLQAVRQDSAVAYPCFSPLSRHVNTPVHIARSPHSGRSARGVDRNRFASCVHSCYTLLNPC